MRTEISTRACITPDSLQTIIWKVMYDDKEVPDYKKCPECNGAGFLDNVKIVCQECAGQGSIRDGTRIVEHMVAKYALSKDCEWIKIEEQEECPPECIFERVEILRSVIGSKACSFLFANDLYEATKEMV